MSAQVTAFISHLVLHFGEPKFDVQDHDKPRAHGEWLKSMVRELKVYSPEALNKAGQIIVTTRKYRSFPLVAECLDACQEAEKWLRSQKPQLKFSGESRHRIPEWSDERVRLADDLVMTETGRRAAREGWILALHDFCRREMRMPEGHEIKHCIDGAKGADAALAMAVRGECGAQSRAIVALGQSILERRERLADMVLHGVVK